MNNAPVEIHDAEIAEVMTELTIDNCPGMQWFEVVE